MTLTLRLQLMKHMLQIIKLHQKGSLIIRGSGARLEIERWKLPGSAIKGLSSQPADKFHLSRLHLAPSPSLVVWGFWPSFLLCENWTCRHEPALVLWGFGAPQETDIFSTSFSRWKASAHHYCCYWWEVVFIFNDADSRGWLSKTHQCL